MQRKTGQPVRFELTEQTRDAVLAWIVKAQLTSGDFLFPSRVRKASHLSTRQYAWIVKSWVALLGSEPEDYGTHSLRRTKTTLIYRRTKNLRAVQLLLGHTKLESTAESDEKQWIKHHMRGAVALWGLELVTHPPLGRCFVNFNLSKPNTNDLKQLPQTLSNEILDQDSEIYTR